MGTESRPGAASLEERIAKLSPEKRAFLERLRREKSEAGSRPLGISRRQASNTAPLSFAQQRLWFLDQLAPGNSFYNETNAIRLAFPLDVTVLEQSVNEIVRRHEALRTTFAVVEGQPVQVIVPRLTLAVPVRDLRALPAAEREAEALRLVAEEVQRPFDLAHSPLLRLTLLRLDDEEYIFLLTMHHIVCDGWSMQVFYRELRRCTVPFPWDSPRRCRSCRSSMRTLRVWQREWLQGEVLATQLAYWKQQLAELPVLQLAHRSAAAGGAELSRERVSAVDIACQPAGGSEGVEPAEGVTLFMTLLAAFQTLLLHRYTGQDDIVVGAPIANRNRAETRRADRVFRQHAGDADESVGQSEFSGAAGAGAGGGAGGVCASGSAV